MERRAILALVLSFAVVALWNSYFMPEVIPEPTSAVTSAQDPASKTERSNTGSPEAKSISQQVEDGVAVEEQPAVPSQPERLNELQSESAVAHFTSVGGGPAGLTLKDYTLRSDPGGLLTFLWGGIKSGGTFGKLIPEKNTDQVTLLEKGGSDSSLRFAPNGDLSAPVVSEQLVSASDEQITYSSRVDGVLVTKQFAYTDDPYLMEWRVTVKNTSARPWKGQPAVAISQVESKVTENPFEVHSSLAYVNDSAEIEDVADLLTGGELDKLDGSVQWIGLGDNYFLSAIIFPEQVMGEVESTSLGDDVVQIAHNSKDSLELAPGASQEFKYLLYIGPKEIDRFTEIGFDLKRTIDFGFLSVFAYPLLYLLKFFYSLVGSYGFAIVLLTVSIKSLTLPLTHKSLASMQRMKEIQPEIKKLQEKHGDNKEALNQEMMRLMADKKVNPLGGCLPTIIQLPVWFALYRVLQSSIELYHTPFMYVNDLSAADPYGVSSILVGVLMFVQQRLQPSAATMDPMQQRMLQFMPLIFSFILFSLPSGLVLYIFVNSSLSILHHTFFLKKAPAAA